MRRLESFLILAVIVQWVMGKSFDIVEIERDFYKAFYEGATKGK